MTDENKNKPKNKKGEKKVKKILITVLAAMAVVGLLAAVGFGSAASTGTITGQIQAGAVNVPDDPDGVTVEYQTQLGGTGDFVITGLIISDIELEGYYVLASLIEDSEGYPFSGIAVQSFLRASAAVSGGIATVNQIYKSGWVPLSGSNYPLAKNVHGVSILIKATQD